MDYNNIEELVERYFECNTTIQEERTLREYFRSEDIPETLRVYRDYFCGINEEAAESLSADFEAKIEERVKREKKRSLFRARFVSLNRSLSPLYKAVASVALVITVGVVSGNYWSSRDPEPVEYNYANYSDTYSDPEIACEKVADVLLDLSSTLKGSGMPDSVIIDQ